MLRVSRAMRYHRLDVGAHDRPDSRLLRVKPKLIGRTFAMPDAFAQSLHRGVEADLVAVAETVHDGSRRVGDWDFAGLNRIPFDSLGHGPAAKPHETNGRVADRWPPRAAFDGHPYRGGHLERQFVEP